jgi:hypothetical protein
LDTLKVAKWKRRLYKEFILKSITAEYEVRRRESRGWSRRLMMIEQKKDGVHP